MWQAQQTKATSAIVSSFKGQSTISMAKLVAASTRAATNIPACRDDPKLKALSKKLVDYYPIGGQNATTTRAIATYVGTMLQVHPLSAAAFLISLCRSPFLLTVVPAASRRPSNRGLHHHPPESICQAARSHR